MNTSYIVALEIGTAKVAVVIAEIRKDGVIDVLGYGIEPSSGVRKGEIMNYENALVCVRAAMRRAEEMADVSIEEVHLVVSGAHVQTVVNRAVVPVCDPSEGISGEDIESVRVLARHYQLPEGLKMLHCLDLLYYLDDCDSTSNPEGIEANRLTHDMLLVYINAQKFRTAVRLVRQVKCANVCDMAFGGMCSSLAVVSPAQRNAGTLVIDLGAGTTDYFAYISGMEAAAGTLGVGGDHIANDVHLAFNIPLGQAERLVRAHGTVESPEGEGAMIRVPSEDGFSGADINATALYLVIQSRLKETLTIIRDKVKMAHGLSFCGMEILLTGGGSRVRGVCDLTRTVFSRPCSMGKPWGYMGPVDVVELPEFAAVLGMLRFAGMHPESRRRGGGWIDRVNRLFVGLFKTPRLKGVIQAIK